MAPLSERLRAVIPVVPDFPEAGVPFLDITPVCRDRSLLREAADAMAMPFKADRIDVVVGVEARGFWFAPLIAASLDAGFAPARKPGKLPRAVIEGKGSAADGAFVAGRAGAGPVATYVKDYEFAVHADAVAGARVLIVDDLLAKGASAACVAELVKRGGGEVVGVTVLIEISGLGGRERLSRLRAEAVMVHTPPVR